MAGGVSDIYFTSLRLAKGETVAEATPAPLVRLPGVSSSTVADAWSGRDTAVDNLTAGLNSRLSGFEKALARFTWPTVAPQFQARLVIRDSGLDGRVDAALAEPGQAVNPNKYFSGGKSAIAASGIAAGDYTFRVAQGTAESTFKVTVAAKDTWGAVLGKVAAAMNGSDNLSVNASVVRQQTPFTLDASLAATGSVLAVSVNARRRDQDVTMADVKGDLLDRLGMTATTANTAPAETGTLEVAVSRLASPTYIPSTGYDANAPTSLAVGLHNFSFAVGSGSQPTSYVSTAYDPDTATTLAPGTYDFGVTMGGDHRDLSVTVKAGWTWGDVENAVAGQISATPTSVWSADGTSTELVASPSFSLPGVTATTKTVSMPAADSATANVSGRVLTISTASGYEGEVLTLSDGSGGVLTALGLTAPLRGTVVSVPVAKGDTWGDVLRKTTQSVAMATGRVDARVDAQTLPPTVVAGALVSNTTTGRIAAFTLLNKRLGESLTLSDGATGLLASLGLDVKEPGQDGEISVNGIPMSSENNAYSLQSGRMTLTAGAVTGGKALPLTVTRNMETVETRLGNVVDAYNAVQKYLAANSDFFESSLSDSLAAPVANNWSGLTALGFSKTRQAGQLWIAGNTFWHTVYTDAGGAAATLDSVPSGLIPAWKTAVADIKKTGTGAFVRPETAHLSRVAVRRSELDLERKNWLVDLLG